jgi:hypothetical protein
MLYQYPTPPGDKCGLNGMYTQKFNHKHGRVGHVFQGRLQMSL